MLRERKGDKVKEKRICDKVLRRRIGNNVVMEGK